MNVRLQYDIEFLAGIYYEDTLQMNSYSASIQMLTMTNDMISTNIAMERLKCFVYSELANTVFISEKYKERAEMMALMGVNITTLPEEPVDQIIGMMLYTKLNAILDGRMTVTNIDISSILGDSVWYQHNEDDELGPLVAPGWWHNSTVQHNSLELIDTQEKVVKVTPSAWFEYGLLWPEEQSENPGNTVVFANFNKNENQPIQ
jgi:hypothetical protein